MKILISEDEHAIAVPYKIALEKRNHEVVITDNGGVPRRISSFIYHTLKHRRKYSYQGEVLLK